MRIVGRLLAGLLIVVIAVALISTVAVGGLLAWVSGRAQPQVSGTLQVPGLAASAEVIRDETGIAHIYADTSDDLFFAQGFVHASERMWQMEVFRHIGAGRVSELFGESQLDTDRFIRTLGWRQAAERDLAALDAPTVRALERYAAGVNAWLGDEQRPARAGLRGGRSPIREGRRPRRLSTGAVDDARHGHLRQAPGLVAGRQLRRRALPPSRRRPPRRPGADRPPGAGVPRRGADDHSHEGPGRGAGRPGGHRRDSGRDGRATRRGRGTRGRIRPPGGDRRRHQRPRRLRHGGVRARAPRRGIEQLGRGSGARAPPGMPSWPTIRISASRCRASGT